MHRRRGFGRAIPVLAGLALVVAAPARADVLVGQGGERIPGTLVEQRDGVIVFDSPLLGRLRVAADRAHVETAAQAPVAASGLRADAPAAPPSKPASPWSADVSIKLSADRGSLKTTEDDLDASLKVVRANAQGELHGTVDYNYKRTDGVLRDDDLFASLSYDRLFAHDRFVAARGLVATELNTEGYDITRSLSLAYGWRLWEGPQRYLRIGPAVGWLSLERGQEHFNGAAAGLYLRTHVPLFKRVDLSAEMQALDSFQDGRYANLDFRIRQTLGERFYLALAWNYQWSDVDIESGITSEWRWVLGWRSDPRE